jgi:hypothetical protein
VDLDVIKLLYGDYSSGYCSGILTEFPFNGFCLLQKHNHNYQQTYCFPVAIKRKAPTILFGILLNLYFYDKTTRNQQFDQQADFY